MLRLCCPAMAMAPRGNCTALGTKQHNSGPIGDVPRRFNAGVLRRASLRPSGTPAERARYTKYLGRAPATSAHEMAAFHRMAAKAGHLNASVSSPSVRVYAAIDSYGRTP